MGVGAGVGVAPGNGSTTIATVTDVTDEVSPLGTSSGSCMVVSLVMLERSIDVVEMVEVRFASGPVTSIETGVGRTETSW